MSIMTRAPALLLVAIVAALIATSVQAENIDPGNDGSQYAWSENTGWINAEPANCSDCGVEVSASELTGWMWGENIGWINTNCSNNGTCGTVNFGVTNDGAGNLAGYAWAENGGWISFSCTNTSYCGTVNYGVTVDGGTGEFEGYAWSENMGWISFSCTNTASCGTVDYGVETAWTAGVPGDTDLDGCPDVNEQQVAPGSETTGGLRDYTTFWDFYDIDTENGPLAGTHLQGAIAVSDIFEVAGRFGQTGSAAIDPLSDASGAGYHTRYDRGPVSGLGNQWNTTAADGSVALSDVFSIAAQFAHSCL